MKSTVAIGLVLLLIVAIAIWLWTPDKDRARLEARYANGPQDFVAVAGLRLHVRDTGPKDAPVVVLLHGLGSSLHTWEAWAQALEGTHRVVRYDLPGAGLSGADPTGDYTDERGMQVLIALLERLGVQRASVIGHSTGGRLAWRFAAKHPARVDKLVLVAPDGFESPGFEYGKKSEVPAAVKLMRYALPKPLLRMSVAPAYAEPAALTDEMMTRYHDLMLAPGVRAAMIARMEQTVLSDPVPVLKTIAAPTLLVWGTRDAMIPIGNADDYIRAMPQVKLAGFPDIGHLPQEETPAAPLAAVRAFLGS